MAFLRRRSRNPVGEPGPKVNYFAVREYRARGSRRRASRDHRGTLGGYMREQPVGSCECAIQKGKKTERTRSLALFPFVSITQSDGARSSSLFLFTFTFFLPLCKMSTSMGRFPRVQPCYRGGVARRVNSRARALARRGTVLPCPRISRIDLKPIMWTVDNHRSSRSLLRNRYFLFSRQSDAHWSSLRHHPTFNFGLTTNQ